MATESHQISFTKTSDTHTKVGFANLRLASHMSSFAGQKACKLFSKLCHVSLAHLVQVAGWIYGGWDLIPNRGVKVP